ncbi:MAG: DUF429 domain-containing protein [Thermoplasmata archaeon]|nr:MAG: DUF429 domain-containing protein [Thermoplasmata archaeon]
MGIDLSWKLDPPKPFRTAAVVLNEKYEMEDAALLTTDDDILAFVKKYKDEGCMVGIDAPLVVPPYQKQRGCEQRLLSCGIGVFPGKREWLVKTFGGIRGEVLVDKLGCIDIPLKDSPVIGKEKSALFEVYPYATWKVLFGPKKVPKNKNTGRVRKEEGLGMLKRQLLSQNPPLKLKGKKEHLLKADIKGLKNRELDQLGDLLDAAVAAYTVLLFYRHGEDRCVVLGDKEEGFILTLVSDCLRRAARISKE